MEFPKAPKRRVSGRLRLQVKAPVINEEVEKDPREAFVGAVDFSSSLEFAFPRGFVVDAAPKDVIVRQKDSALRWLEKLDKKVGDCHDCRKNTAQETIDRARKLVEYVCVFLKDHAHNYVTVVVNRQVDGTITVNFTIRDRELVAIIHPDHFELGRYFEGLLISESEFKGEFPLPNDCLSWLSEG